MAVVLLAIVEIKRCVLQLTRKAKVKIPEFPKETRTMEHYYVSEQIQINGEQYIFSFKCDPPLREEEMKKMMVNCAVISPGKGMGMEMPILYESVDTIINTIDTKETVIKCIKFFEELIHDVEDFDPYDDDKFDFDD